MEEFCYEVGDVVVTAHLEPDGIGIGHAVDRFSRISRGYVIFRWKKYPNGIPYIVDGTSKASRRAPNISEYRKCSRAQ